MDENGNANPHPASPLAPGGHWAGVAGQYLGLPVDGKSAGYSCPECPFCELPSDKLQRRHMGCILTHTNVFPDQERKIQKEKG